MSLEIVNWTSQEKWINLIYAVYKKLEVRYGGIPTYLREDTSSLRTHHL